MQAYCMPAWPEAATSCEVEITTAPVTIVRGLLIMIYPCGFDAALGYEPWASFARPCIIPR